MIEIIETIKQNSVLMFFYLTLFITLMVCLIVCVRLVVDSIKTKFKNMTVIEGVMIVFYFLVAIGCLVGFLASRSFLG